MTSAGDDVVEFRVLMHCFWEHKMVQPLGKQSGRFSKGSASSYHMAQQFPFLDMYLRELENIHTQKNFT